MLIKQFLKLIGYTLVITYGVVSLRFMFIPILIAGEVTYIEPNLKVLTTEIIIASLICILGLALIWIELGELGKRRE